MPTEAIEFRVNDDTLRGDLFRPEGVLEPPLVVMAHGFGLERRFGLPAFAERLRAAGLASERRILSFSFIEAPPRVRDILGERQVLEVRRLNLADGQPFALVTVWCPEELGAELSRADVERASFLEQLPVELGGASQTIGAEAAQADVAQLLDVPVGSPLLVAERVTRTVGGRPVLVSRHVFAAHRTEFAVELPAATDVLGPAGLRLVE